MGKMRIYYSLEFSGDKKESQAFLGKAIERYLAAEKLNTEVDTETLLEKIEKGPKGKPSIPGFSPYSISHTGKCWAVLFSDAECGLDVQEWKQANIEEIGIHFYNEDEFIAVIQEGEGEFFRIWARREAFRKAQGESVFTACESVMFHIVETGDETDGSRRLWRIQDVSMPVDVYAAVCVDVTAQTEEFHQANAAAADYEITIERL